MTAGELVKGECKGAWFVLVVYIAHIQAYQLEIGALCVFVLCACICVCVCVWVGGCCVVFVCV